MDEKTTNDCIDDDGSGKKHFITSTKCGQPNAHGRPCRLPAGWGTEHFGTGPCRYHPVEGVGGEPARHVPLTQLVDPELRPLVLRMIEDDKQLFDFRFELAVLRAMFAEASGSELILDDEGHIIQRPPSLQDMGRMAKDIASTAVKLRELEQGRHVYIHINVIGLVLQAVGEVARQYLHTDSARRAFKDDLVSAVRPLLGHTTARAIATSALVEPVAKVVDTRVVDVKATGGS